MATAGAETTWPEEVTPVALSVSEKVPPAALAATFTCKVTLFGPGTTLTVEGVQVTPVIPRQPTLTVPE